MDVDLTRGLDLQIAHNAYVHFVIGNIPVMPTRKVTSYVAHWWLKLGWLSLASRRHLQLIALFYDIQCRKNPERLFVKIKVPENIPMQSLRSPPAIYEYEAPRTHTCDTSFTISKKLLANRLSITDFNLTRLKELKAWAYNVFIVAEFKAWRANVELKGLVNVTGPTDLSHPVLPFFEATFTTPGRIQ